MSGETRRGGEDKMLEDLAGWVTEIYRSCIGENVVTIPSVCTVASSVTVCSQAKISTIDMLHHIEMRMETLTQQLEALNPAKVNITYLYIYSIYTYISTYFISTYLQPLYLHIYTGGGGAGVVRGGAPRPGEGGSAGAAAQHGGHQEQGSAGPRPRPALQVAAELPTNLCEVSQFPEKAPTGLLSLFLVESGL